MSDNRYITQFPKYNAYLLNGKVWVGGASKVIKDNEVYENPDEIEFPKGTQIVQVAYGLYHYVALDSEGYVWGWGKEKYGNLFGQLGIGKHIGPTKTPTKITNMPKMKKVCCGSFYTLCLDTFNNLWGLGHNNHHQIGFGDSEKAQYKPIKVREGVLDVYAGKNSDTTFIININNEVEAIGWNLSGNAGIWPNSYNVGKSFTQVKSLNGKGKISKIDSNLLSTFCLYENGDIYSTGSPGTNGRNKNSCEFLKIDKRKNIIDLACLRYDSTIFVTKYGEVLMCIYDIAGTWGSNNVRIRQFENLNITLPKNIKGKLRNFNINGIYKHINGKHYYDDNGDFVKYRGKKIVLAWCTPRAIKKKKEMKDCSHCKKKITIGKEFKYKRKKGEEKFNFHFECLRELSEDFQEEIKDKMKRDLL